MIAIPLAIRIDETCPTILGESGTFSWWEVNIFAICPGSVFAEHEGLGIF